MKGEPLLESAPILISEDGAEQARIAAEIAALSKNGLRSISPAAVDRELAFWLYLRDHATIRRTVSSGTG